MTQPRRIQRKRTKGWRMPANTVYIGRPTKYGNPFNWKNCPSDAGPPEWARVASVDLFREWVWRKEQEWLRIGIREKLRGKDLACWCPEDQPCHGDVLLRIANYPTGSGTSEVVGTADRSGEQHEDVEIRGRSHG